MTAQLTKLESTLQEVRAQADVSKAAMLLEIEQSKVQMTTEQTAAVQLAQKQATEAHDKLVQSQQALITAREGVTKLEAQLAAAALHQREKVSAAASASDVEHESELAKFQQALAAMNEELQQVTAVTHQAMRELAKARQQLDELRQQVTASISQEQQATEAFAELTKRSEQSTKALDELTTKSDKEIAELEASLEDLQRTLAARSVQE